MKIALILPHFYPYVGGGEKMFFDLAKGLIDEGHEVRVVARNVGEEYLGEKTVEGINIRYCRWKSMFGHPLVSRSDIEDVIRWCDIVHTSIFTTSPVVSRLARKYKKPSVLTVYETRGPKWYWCENFVIATGFYLFEQYTIRQKFDVYHAISEATKKDTEKFCRLKNVKRVYLANEMRKDAYSTDFSLRSYFGIPEDTRVVLYYGRPGKTKGIQVYEKAIENLALTDRIPKDVKLCFVLGKEPENLRKEFAQLIEKKKLTESVLIRDSVKRDELCACIAQADVVVVPSLTEGFGFSALEACQIGTPLIYSDGGSLPEVAYGKCLSFENRNHKQLADILEEFFINGTDNFEDVPEKTFTYEQMFKGISDIYSEIYKEAE